MKACHRYLRLVLLTFSMVAFSQRTQAKAAQTPKTPHAEETTEAQDPLGRSTPYGTVFGFLQAVHGGKNKQATQYLQLSGQEREYEGERLAHELQALMDKAFIGRVGAISHQREGSIQSGVPEDHERIGSFRVNGTETAVDLVRVTDQSGAEIWLFSAEVLAQVPRLLAEIENSELESRLPGFLVTTQIFSTPLWQLIALLLLVPVSLALAWLMVRLFRGVRRIWRRRGDQGLVEDVHDSLVGPATLILSVAFNEIGAYLLGSPLLIREYYRRITGLLLAAGVTWLLVRVINRWGERARLQSLASSRFRNGSLIVLGQRIFKILAVIVCALIMLAILGFNITAAVAGLGIGSIAIAFAAQKTLENLLGGISILGDQVIRVGELCRIGEHTGRVEDISLRSTSIRTLDGTALSVPNGKLANMTIENITRREKTLFRATIGLRSDTGVDQLRSVLEQTRALLRRHPKVDTDVARVHFVEVGESSLDIGIECLILTSNREEFLAIREELLFEIMELVAARGVEFATPARRLHIAQAQEGDQQQAARTPTVIRPRARN
jgi:MscS family membrane protein